MGVCPYVWEQNVYNYILLPDIIYYIIYYIAIFFLLYSFLKKETKITEKYNWWTSYNYWWSDHEMYMIYDGVGGYVWTQKNVYYIWQK